MKKQTTTAGERRSIWIPSLLWTNVKRAAARASGRAGESITASEWVREALREKLAREEH